MISNVVTAVVDANIAAPVSSNAADEQRWTDFDLASLAETRLGDATDPRALSPDRRRLWQTHAAAHQPLSPSEREQFGYRCLWLLDHDTAAPIGTIALSTPGLAHASTTLSSLYVLPTHRRRGIATRALRTMVDHLSRDDVALSLHAHWPSPRPLHLYLREGLWAHSFKDDIRLIRYPDDPPPILDVGPDTAHVAIEHDGDLLPLCRATRKGDQLLTFDRPGSAADRLLGQAESTLALAIALAGWPLVRHDQIWDGRWCGDAGSPEALASHIINAEAYHRHRGWRVDTPTIPGLPSPTWQQLQAGWRAA